MEQQQLADHQYHAAIPPTDPISTPTPTTVTLSSPASPPREDEPRLAQLTDLDQYLGNTGAPIPNDVFWRDPVAIQQRQMTNGFGGPPMEIDDHQSYGAYLNGVGRGTARGGMHCGWTPMGMPNGRFDDPNTRGTEQFAQAPGAERNKNKKRTTPADDDAPPNTMMIVITDPSLDKVQDGLRSMEERQAVAFHNIVKRVRALDQKLDTTLRSLIGE